MNILKNEKREAIIGGLVEGISIRSLERMTGVHRDTIMRLLVSTGGTCENLMDTKMHNLLWHGVSINEKPGNAWPFTLALTGHPPPINGLLI